MKKILICVVAITVMTFAFNASATPITFTHEGSGSYSLDGSPFAASDFVITATGDTNNQNTSGSGFFINHDLATIDIDGLGILTFITTTNTFVNNNNELVGFNNEDASRDLFNGPNDTLFSTWDMLSSIGPITGPGNLLQWTDSDVVTDGGVLVFQSGGTDATFTATVNAVPEPATMLLVGYGLVGLGVFRKKLKK